ncbi:hypothetical protein BD410DRAFT_804488 [Rickenella mellea]|uniref:Uncharacterized protein n=1 Tax=Rickenella mellea TaxID=50990 RepID=A0A4Y7Q0X3_9AGAM|nr:hypothetical protein BD410DRAFT_804488 [Rickenella mellea]
MEDVQWNLVKELSDVNKDEFGTPEKGSNKDPAREKYSTDSANNWSYSTTTTELGVTKNDLETTKKFGAEEVAVVTKASNKNPKRLMVETRKEVREMVRVAIQRWKWKGIVSPELVCEKSELGKGITCSRLRASREEAEVVEDRVKHQVFGDNWWTKQTHTYCGLQRASTPEAMSAEPGTYTIQNVRHRSFATQSPESTVVADADTDAGPSYGPNLRKMLWTIARLNNDKYTIKNIETEGYAALTTRPVFGDGIVSKQTRQQWAIKETDFKGRYVARICTTAANTELFWGLGAYTIQNVMHRNFAAQSGESRVVAHVDRAKTADGDQLNLRKVWSISRLDNDKYTIRNIETNDYAAAPHFPAVEENITATQDLHQWDIRETGFKGRYAARIFTTAADIDLFWGLTNGQLRTPISLRDRPNTPSNQWELTKVESWSVVGKLRATLADLRDEHKKLQGEHKKILDEHVKLRDGHTKLQNEHRKKSGGAISALSKDFFGIGY